MEVLLAEAAAPADSLLQYGALGVLALLALAAVKVLFDRMSKAYDLERARADRLEAEVRALNNAIQERYLTVLAQANAVIGDALVATRRDH